MAGVKTKSRVPDEAKIIGANLKKLRRLSGLSLQDVGNILQVTHQQIQKYETGQNRLPLEKMFSLKKYYGVPYEFFFKGLGSPF